MHKRYDYAVVGGGVAGGYAVDAIRQRDPQGSIGLFSADRYRPYNRPPLSKEILLGLQTPEQAFLHPPEYYGEQHIDLRLQTHVTALRPAEQMIELEDGTPVGYGKLLYATGAQARRLNVPGSDLAGVYTLRSLDDCLAIEQAMQRSKTAVIIGGSFIGAELASAFAQQGVETTMVFPEPHLFGRLLDEDLGEQMDRFFQDHGVRVLKGHTPTRLDGQEGHVAAVTIDDGQRLPCDFVVLGVGVQLNVDLARAAGLAMSPEKGIVANRFLQSSVPDIYLAGDVASYEDVVFGQGHLRVEHWDTALRHGMAAGANMAGEQRVYDSLPYFFSLLFGLYIQVWGSMVGWDQVVARGRFESGSFARFYFRQGVLNAVLAAAQPREDLQTVQQWIRERRRYGEIAGLLADENVELTAEALPA